MSDLPIRKATGYTSCRNRTDLTGDSLQTPNETNANLTESDMSKKNLTPNQRDAFGAALKNRFDAHPNRHPNLSWEVVWVRLERQPDKLRALHQMELTGGEPDVVSQDPKTGICTFYDCAPESPTGRRSLCYDPAALASRKENKPRHSALGLAADIGIEMLTEQEYHALQQFGPFDQKTSSWLKTPEDVRTRGGALFGDLRYGRVFTYHNGATSYYAVRGFRGKLLV